MLSVSFFLPNFENDFEKMKENTGFIEFDNNSKKNEIITINNKSTVISTKKEKDDNEAKENNNEGEEQPKQQEEKNEIHDENNNEEEINVNNENKSTVISTKKEKIFSINKIKKINKKLGRKKLTDNEETKVLHDKYSFDNTVRKIKAKLFNAILAILNKSLEQEENNSKLSLILVLIIVFCSIFKKQPFLTFIFLFLC